MQPAVRTHPILGLYATPIDASLTKGMATGKEEKRSVFGTRHKLITDFTCVRV